MKAIVYGLDIAKKYSTFYVPKKSGGQREIKAPTPKLKKLQSHLARILCECLEEIDREREGACLSFGVKRGSSVIKNAAQHKGRRWVFNFDLENFFPAFNYGRVRGFFLKDKKFTLHPVVATTIAQIACDGEALPQGSPCSPVIAELVAQILDARLVRLVKKYGVRYTRYVDDITFSTNQKDFPADLALVDPGNPSRWLIGNATMSAVEGAGFSINKFKTRMSFRDRRQMVTGFVVNKKVNIRSDYYRRSRAMCDRLFKIGTFISVLP
ncbi:reverse transcriptase family protein [Bombella sp. TMW 2.2559]|uniref:RNA-directed DNA polymerase n=1 Tax=Bombella dulcis TaxID=2967339 RepID=A0ABT3WCC8_9PROT|nr:reverse transcriptase domain-containing protein [Bombella dulcis]MCX5616606.1 reverse transcriptase family protein [Bombella dulcis]